MITLAFIVGLLDTPLYFGFLNAEDLRRATDTAWIVPCDEPVVGAVNGLCGAAKIDAWLMR